MAQMAGLCAQGPHAFEGGRAWRRAAEQRHRLLRTEAGHVARRAPDETFLLDPELPSPAAGPEEHTFFVENLHPNQSPRPGAPPAAEKPGGVASPPRREAVSLAVNWRRRKKHILEKIAELEQEQSSLQGAAVQPAPEEKTLPAVEASRLPAAPRRASPPPPSRLALSRRKAAADPDRDIYAASVLRLSEIDASDLTALFTRAPPPGRTLQLTLFRQKAGLARRFFPHYRLALSEDGGLALGEAVKRATRGGSLYELRAEDGRVWPLRSNFIGTEFTLGAAGEELAFVEYQQNFLGIKGPRKFGVALPAGPGAGLREALREHAHERARLFWNNPPRWSEQHGAYVLDFFDRVERASVKNFQLLAGEELALQFGKAREDVFHLDVRAPFSPLQALGIAVSSCDGKLFCE